MWGPAGGHPLGASATGAAGVAGSQSRGGPHTLSACAAGSSCAAAVGREGGAETLNLHCSWGGQEELQEQCVLLPSAVVPDCKVLTCMSPCSSCHSR